MDLISGPDGTPRSSSPSSTVPFTHYEETESKSSSSRDGAVPSPLSSPHRSQSVKSAAVPGTPEEDEDRAMTTQYFVSPFAQIHGSIRWTTGCVVLPGARVIVHPPSEWEPHRNAAEGALHGPSLRSSSSSSSSLSTGGSSVSSMASEVVPAVVFGPYTLLEEFASIDIYLSSSSSSAASLVWCGGYNRFKSYSHVVLVQRTASSLVEEEEKEVVVSEAEHVTPANPGISPSNSRPTSPSRMDQSEAFGEPLLGVGNIFYPHATVDLREPYPQGLHLDQKGVDAPGSRSDASSCPWWPFLIGNFCRFGAHVQIAAPYASSLRSTHPASSPSSLWWWSSSSSSSPAGSTWRWWCAPPSSCSSTTTSTAMMASLETPANTPIPADEERGKDARRHRHGGSGGGGRKVVHVVHRCSFLVGAPSLETEAVEEQDTKTERVPGSGEEGGGGVVTCDSSSSVAATAALHRTTATPTVWVVPTGGMRSIAEAESLAPPPPPRSGATTTSSPSSLLPTPVAPVMAGGGASSADRSPPLPWYSPACSAISKEEERSQLDVEQMCRIYIEMHGGSPLSQDD